VLLALGLAACSTRRPPVSSAGARAPTAPAVDLQLATFEQAWKRIAETYPYADFHGLDWPGVRDELLPRAEAARTPRELRPVLEEMLARLGESHFAILPQADEPATQHEANASDAPAPAAAPSGSRLGTAGIDVRQLGTSMIVTRVAAGSAASQAGIRPGVLLLAAGDLHAVDAIDEGAREGAGPMARYSAWIAMTSALHGAPGDPLHVSVKEEDDTVEEHDLVLGEAPGVVTRMGNLPALPVEVESRTLEQGVGYVRFNWFFVPVVEPFARAIEGFTSAGAPGVVIDLRGNPGGIGAMVMGMAGHFIGEKDRSLGTMTTRDAELHFVAIPKAKAQRFDGPVAILVDELSLSTSELFAGGMQGLHRARVFGRRTGGMALPSVIELLPNGDRLQFAIADLTGPDGTRIEGRGVIPDEEVPLRREDLFAGRDADLDAAVAWLLSRRTANVSTGAAP
jgi:carboxyl-terminal processing protease